MQARQQSIDEPSYNNGPQLHGFTSDVSLLQWRTAIDNERLSGERLRAPA